uniref:Expressed protein n=2 Tax=Schizophyllum commune (strain H4-8 / FGSC 9210) TaxID=578458 RepID=D8QDP1_SCHCM
MTDVVRVDGVLPIPLMKCKSGERVKGLDGEEVRTLSGDEVVELLDDEQPHAKAAACALEHSASASASSHASPSSPTSPSHHASSSHPTTFDPLSIYDPLTSATSSPLHPSTPPHHLPSALHEPWALTTALRVPARGLRPTNENRAANVLITHALAVTMRVGVRPGEEVAPKTSQEAGRTGQAPVVGERNSVDQPRRSSEADDRRHSGLSAGVNLAEVVLEEKLFDVTIRMPVHVYSPLCTPDALCLPMYEEEDSSSSHSDDRSTDDERVGRDRRHIRRVAEAAAGVVPWI